MFEDFEDAGERSHLRGENGEDGPTILDDITLANLMLTHLAVDEDTLGNTHVGYTQEADAIRKMAPAVKAVQELRIKPGPLVSLRPGDALSPQVLVIESPMREIYAAAAAHLSSGSSFTMHQLSPYLQAIADVIDDLAIVDLPPIETLALLPAPSALKLLELLLGMERSLREQVCNGVLAKRAATVRRRENKNYHSGKRLFEACSMCSSKIMSVRMDLLFHPDSTMRITPRTPDDRLWVAKRLKNLILQHRTAVKGRFKRGLLGWIYKIEFGESGGFHIHCWYLFNQHLHRLERHLCGFIENQWVQLTMGEGYCRRAKARFLNAVGLLDLSDPKVQAGIHEILWYLTKGDELIALELEDGSRTFLRSRLPVPRKLGRPRKQVIADYGYANRRGNALPGFKPWTSISALKKSGLKRRGLQSPTERPAVPL